jgi:hypothetical protein
MRSNQEADIAKVLDRLRITIPIGFVIGLARVTID